MEEFNITNFGYERAKGLFIRKPGGGGGELICTVGLSGLIKNRLRGKASGILRG